ncbi:hypothetical protein [Alicyclobacillus mengziensis]|uniref:Uncharacterized protein n=1 Tax=Alicyclobacillus mengziensis TaxID=2931921 RepID=A0A9X7VXI2_9BACL|nr:hypothetical protein [Alicyclobacillus mengziensis]QSO46901.1 hypothetical protein JZ786_21120 [Alicyclobacillus mengziensis]
MSSEERVYFECTSNKLDVAVQRERWFGAVWVYKNGIRRPLEYWFEDSEDKVYEQWQKSRYYGYCNVLFTPYPIDQVYNIVREQQIKHMAAAISKYLDESGDN